MVVCDDDDDDDDVDEGRVLATPRRTLRTDVAGPLRMGRPARRWRNDVRVANERALRDRRPVTRLMSGGHCQRWAEGLAWATAQKQSLVVVRVAETNHCVKWRARCVNICWICCQAKLHFVSEVFLEFST